VCTVPYPVHEAQGRKSQRVGSAVVLEQYCVSRDASGFREQYARVVGVVQHVYQHDGVHRAIRPRNPGAVKSVHRDGRSVAGQALVPLDSDAICQRLDQRPDATVAAADIHHLPTRFGHARESSSEALHATAVYELPVDLAECVRHGGLMSSSRDPRIHEMRSASRFMQ